MIDVVYWSPEDKCVDVEYLKREDVSSAILLNKVFSDEYSKSPELHSIEIETINACNNDCSFCPASKKNDTRIHKFMSEELFKKIIAELEVMQYSGVLSLFSNNEPLLDKRIFKFIEYARKHLPNAKHALFTNGILLDTEKFEHLCKHLDKLVIDNYNDDLKLNPNIKNIVEIYSERTIECNVKIFVRKKNQIRDSRGGQAPNREKVFGFTSACMLPITQMIVRPDGKISLCCQDAMGLVTLGDVSSDSIRDVWTGKEYAMLRSKLSSGMRCAMPYCCNCDIFGIINYRPRRWDSLIIKGFLEWIDTNKCTRIYVSGCSKFYNKIVQLVSGLSVDVVSFKHDKWFLDKDEVLCVEDNDSNIVAPFESAGQKVGEKILICGVLNTVEHQNESV